MATDLQEHRRRMALEPLLAGLRAAAEPTRLRLLAILARNELTVTELTHILGISQPRVSRHLKLLSDAGLIDRFREGTWVFYRLADTGEGARLAQTVSELTSDDDPELARNFARLEEIRTARTAKAAQYFEENAAEWDRIRSLYISEQDVERAMREMVEARLGQGKRLHQFVDLGTGTGRILQLFAPRAQASLGIDQSQEMLRLARANLEQTSLSHWQVRYGDVLNLALPSDSADLVTLHQVLHFMNDPERVIAEAGRILKPGGRLLVVDFAPHHLEFLREEHAHRRLGFAEAEVITWCESAGLRVEDIRHLHPNRVEGRIEGENHNSQVKEKLTVSLWLGIKERQTATQQGVGRTL